MSTRELARHWMRQVPPQVDHEAFVAWTADLAARASDDEALARALHRLHGTVLAIGLGQGARHMHARLGGADAAPSLAGLQTPEALLVTVGAILAAAAAPTTSPLDAGTAAACADGFEALHRKGPDVYDELLLEASGRAARDPAWRDAVREMGAALAGAGRWLRRGPGKALEQQAAQLATAWAALDLDPPAHPRFTPWAQHLWVAAVVVAGLHPRAAERPAAPRAPAGT